MSLQSALKETFEELTGDTTILVGFSGGADSVALLDLTHQLRGKGELIALHLNHSLRGEFSDGDEEFCRQFCAEREISFISRKLDIGRITDTNKANLEETARIERRKFFCEVAQKFQKPLLLLAHHRDDQLETVLMRLLRSSGWRGLGGIRKNSSITLNGLPELPVFRPLLDTPRQELVAYLKENKLKWREDASNADISYERNRLRHAVLPALRKIIPEANSQLLTFSRTATIIDTALNSEAAKIRASFEFGGIFFALTEFDNHPDTVKVRAVENNLQKLEPELRLRGNDHQSISKVLAGELKSAMLATGHLIRREYDGYFICSLENDVDKNDSVLMSSNDFVFDYHAETFSLQSEQTGLPLGTIKDQSNPNIEYFNIDAIKPPLLLRMPRTGERMTPAGMKGSKKISDIFTDQKIPVRVRQNTPVLADSEGVIWLPPFKVTARTLITDSASGSIKVVFSRK